MPRRLPIPALALALPLAAACASHASSPPDAAVVHGPPLLPGFDPGPVPAGFERYVTPVVPQIAPGDDRMWCQWLTDPLDHTQDVLALTGAQSKYGHHVVLYATPDGQSVGTTRECATTDMFNLRFLGFVAGESGPTSQGTLPDGVAVRVPAAMALMASVHFVNTGDAPVDGQAAIDVKLADYDPSRTVASFFVNTTLKLAVMPRASASYDANCTVTRDLPFFMAANHMHANGVAALTEVIHADGSRADLIRDDGWSAERTFNPAWSRWPVGAPLVVHPGDTIHTRCTWDNAGATELQYPDEMCAGFGFFLGDVTQIECVDGAWTG